MPVRSTAEAPPAPRREEKTVPKGGWPCRKNTLRGELRPQARRLRRQLLRLHLLEVRESEDVVREVKPVDIVTQDLVDVGLSDELEEAVLELVLRHLLALLEQQRQELVPAQRAVLLLHRLERLLHLLRPDGEDRSVVHVELHEVLEVNTLHDLAGLRELGVLDLRDHVLDLQL